MSTAAIEPTSLKDLIRERSRSAYALKWMGDEQTECQVSGIFYVFEPGVLTHIKDREDWKRGKRGALLTNEPKVVVEGGSAEDIVGEILSESRLGARGLAVHLGDGGDEDREKLARRLYLEFRVNVSRQVQAEWISTCEKALRNPGSLPPVQTHRVRDAITFLRRYEAGLIDRAAFICKLDGFESNDRAAMLRYVRETYPQQVENAGGPEKLVIVRDEYKPVPETVTTQAAAEAKPTTVAPPAPAAAEPGAGLAETDVSWVIAKAEELGVKLGKADYVGLIRRDGAVIEEIAGRLAEAHVKKTSQGKGGANGRKR